MDPAESLPVRMAREKAELPPSHPKHISSEDLHAIVAADTKARAATPIALSERQRQQLRRDRADSEPIHESRTSPEPLLDRSSTARADAGSPTPLPEPRQRHDESDADELFAEHFAHSKRFRGMVGDAEDSWLHAPGSSRRRRPSNMRDHFEGDSHRRIRSDVFHRRNRKNSSDGGDRAGDSLPEPLLAVVLRENQERQDGAATAIEAAGQVTRHGTVRLRTSRHGFAVWAGRHFVVRDFTKELMYFNPNPK